MINGWRYRTIRGGDYHVLRVLQSWKEHEISLVLPKLGYESTRQILPDYNSIYFSSNRVQDSETLLGVVTSYIYRIVKSLLFSDKEHYDVVISSSHLMYDILPSLFLRRKLRSKLVVYVHHIFRSFRSHREGLWSTISLLSESISLFLCKNADLIFVINDEIKRTLINKGFPTERIFITGNGLEHEFIDSVRANPDEFDGCFCGSLDKKKGIYDLIYVWEKISSSIPLSRLIIIGQGPEYSRLLKMIRDRHLEKHILVAGYLSEEQKISTMKSSKLFIFPSYEEGWGISISEAMACGLPVVCYDLGAYDVFGNGVIKIDVGNKEEMVKVVNDLLTDKNKQKEAGLRAKDATKHLSWETIAEDELKLINTL